MTTGTRNGEGDVAARHAVRGVRVQLHRADRRPRRRHARPHAGERQGAQGPAAPPRHHEKGLRVRARRGGSDPLPRRREVRPRRRLRAEGERETCVHADLRRLDLRHRRRRPARGRDHAGDARGLRARPLLAGISGALLRRGHRRAARGHVCRGTRVRGDEADRRHLFDVPAARLRPAHSRCRAAETGCRVRDRPRRDRRGRRRDALRRLRLDLSALRAQHDGDGALRRERVPADALHRLHARLAGRGSLPRAVRAPVSRSRRG